MEDKVLSALTKSLMHHLKTYQEDLKKKDGWCLFYKQELKLVFPVFDFEEDYDTFKYKIEKMFDLQDFAYLYVKLTESPKYLKENHQKMLRVREVILKFVNDLSLEEYHMIRGLLKTNQFGLN
jgi:hypothetical protein